MWDYIFFIAYLEQKEYKLAKDFSQLERFVSNKVDQGDISWMPCY